MRQQSDNDDEDDEEEEEEAGQGPDPLFLVIQYFVSFLEKIIGLGVDLDSFW